MNIKTKRNYPRKVIENRYIFLFLAIPIMLLSCPQVSSAVAGLSSGKCIMPWARTLNLGTMQFEPALAYATFGEELDENGNAESLDGRYQATIMSFRATAGLTKKLEMGMNFGIQSESYIDDKDADLDQSETSLSDPAVGWKYRFWGDNESGPALAFQWGIGLPMVSRGSYAVWEAGLVFSLPFGKSWLLDIDGSYFLTSETSPGDPEKGALYDIGIGVDLAEKWTVAFELNGAWEHARETHTESWNIMPTLGFAYKVNDTFCVCILSQNDIPGLGKNTEMANLTQILFTFTYE